MAADSASGSFADYDEAEPIEWGDKEYQDFGRGEATFLTKTFFVFFVSSLRVLCAPSFRKKREHKEHEEKENKEHEETEHKEHEGRSTKNTKRRKDKPNKVLD